MSKNTEDKINELENKVNQFWNQINEFNSMNREIEDKISELYGKVNEFHSEINNLKTLAKKDKKWPKNGDMYYVIEDDEVFDYAYYGEHCDEIKISCNNFFKTRKEAEDRIVLMKLIARARDMVDGFVPDLNDDEQEKWAVYVNNSYIFAGKVITVPCFSFLFPSHVTCTDFINSMNNEERKIWIRGFN